MKTLLLTLLFPVLLKSCDGTPDQVGHEPAPISTPNGGGPSADPNGPGSTTDVPLDGGLSILLLAGVGYGVKRYRSNKAKVNQEKVS